jgi:fructose-1,6-bisphosphatase/inositol monophosphatase family enzyme
MQHPLTLAGLRKFSDRVIEGGSMSDDPLDRARRLLCALQTHLRDTLVAARRREQARFATVAAITAADTIYHVDKLGEAAIEAWLARHWPRDWPLQLVMEGIEDDAPLTFPRGTPVAATRWRCIIDPIDGTRNLMYDKRSAWILTALAPQRGARTTLADIVVAAMTELPTSKQAVSDQISAVRGRGRAGIVARRVDLRTGRGRAFEPRPSGAKDFAHGFASLVKFFPDGKELTARLEEALWRELGGTSTGGNPLIFDDQNLTTGGQLYELLAGHDRMIGDLRPLVFARLGLKSSLTCHPYDICTELILREAGGVVEAPLGGRLRAPLDTTSPVAWIGYANASLARRVRPVLRRLIREHLGAAG